MAVTNKLGLRLLPIPLTLIASVGWNTCAEVLKVGPTRCMIGPFLYVNHVTFDTMHATSRAVKYYAQKKNRENLINE